MSPEDALNNLLDGNKRFVAQKRQERNTAEEISATVNGVDAFAVVVSCMDARVNPEQIFDTKIGDMYVLRVGGGVLNDDIIDSIEIATNISNIKVIVMLGHTKCGAIVNATKNRKSDTLSQLITKVLPAIDAASTEVSDPSPTNAQFLRKAEEAQVSLSVQQLRVSSVTIENLINEKQFIIVGAMYDVENGLVTVLNTNN